MATTQTNNGSTQMQSRIQAGEPALGLLLRQARTTDVGRAMRTAGVDWAFIDLEHNYMGVDIASQLAIAIQDAGVTPIARVPKNDYALATRLLDGGAMGIVMPHVDDVGEALRFVKACRYPPQGSRSLAGGLPQIGFRPLPIAEAIAIVESQTLLFPMVETQSGADNVEAICATTGVNGILLGLSDLAVELGIPGQVGHDRVRAIVKSSVDACRKHKKWIGLGGVADPALIEEYMQLGMDFVLMGSDLAFLISSVTARVKLLRKNE